MICDSHPLSLGATPSQVFIDGIPQITSPSALNKLGNAQRPPQTPDYEQEIADAVKYEGLPPLGPLRSRTDVVVFTNVSNVWLSDTEGTISNTFAAVADIDRAVVVVQDGRIVCHGVTSNCATYVATIPTVVDLQGGSLQPGLVTVGSSLGLQEIAMEESTTDGMSFDPMHGEIPSIAPHLPRAVDGLIYGTRDSL